MTRGEIFWADLGIPFGSEAGFKRPVIVIQSDSFNQSNINTVIIVPLTTNLAFENSPGNILIEKRESRLGKDAVANVSLLTAIDKKRLIEKAGSLKKYTIMEIEKGISLVLNISGK